VRPEPEAGKTRDTKTGKRKRGGEDTAKPSAAQNIEGRLLEKGAWPQVVSEAVTSGNLRETLLGLTGVLKEGSPAPDEGSTDAPVSQP